MDFRFHSCQSFDINFDYTGFPKFVILLYVVGMCELFFERLFRNVLMTRMLVLLKWLIPQLQALCLLMPCHILQWVWLLGQLEQSRGRLTLQL